MSYEAKIVLDSVSREGIRLITFFLRYPRYVHAELLTHRVFSRNASSSRAIPVNRLVSYALDDMVHPIYWGRNQKGMQASDEVLTGEDLATAIRIWEDMAEYCANGVSKLGQIGLHKQWANRPLEWFSHINVVVTSTSWANFFSLRDHPDAQPEIRHLASLMKAQYDASIPTLIEVGEWHLPWINPCERNAPVGTLLKVSAARCARTSYLTFDGKVSTLEDDEALCNKLIGSAPLHASPFEHQASPDQKWFDGEEWRWELEHQHGNFTGWKQYRKMLALEYVEDIPYDITKAKGYKP